MTYKPNYPQGPYHYRRDKDGCDECFDIIAGDGKTVLASLPFWDDEDGGIEATARLFATAPELAEILESLIDQISELKGESSVIDYDLMQGEAFGRAVAILVRIDPRAELGHKAAAEGVKNRSLVVIWCIDDVRDIRPDLDDDQAGEVLRSVEKHHDCNSGVTWETLEFTASKLYPQSAAK